MIQFERGPRPGRSARRHAGESIGKLAGSALLALAITVAAIACGGDSKTAGDPETPTAPATTEPTTPAATATSTASPTPEATATPSPVPTPSGSTRKDPVPVGTGLSVGGWRVTVVGVDADAWDVIRAENRFNSPPDAGHQFFMVQLSATYLGTKEPARFDLDVSLKAVGDLDVAYAEYSHSCGVIPGDFDDAREVFAGGTITSNVCWEIPTSDAESLLMYGEESFSFNSRRVWWELTPTDAPLAASGPTAVVSGSETCLFLRTSPSTSASTITCVPEGTNVSLVSTERTFADGRNWLQASVNGSIGWLAEQYLAVQ